MCVENDTICLIDKASSSVSAIHSEESSEGNRFRPCAFSAGTLHDVCPFARLVSSMKHVQRF